MTDELREKMMSMDEREWREFVYDLMCAGELRFEAHQSAIAENTVLTKQIASSTAEIVDAFTTTKRGLHFFQGAGNLLNRAARWLLPIVTLVGAIWAILHGHSPKGGQ